MEEKVKNKGRNKGYDNLIPIKKGEVRNPTGRPKGQRDYATIYREALIKLGTLNGKTPDELENEILSNALLSARKGDYRFYKDVTDRIHGTAIQKSTIELSGQVDGVEITDAVRKVTESFEKQMKAILTAKTK